MPQVPQWHDATGVESPSSTVAVAAYDSGIPFLIDDKDFQGLGSCQFVPNVHVIVSSAYECGAECAASRRRLIKGATFCTGEMLSRALGMNLNKGETSSWGRRHPHSRGRDYNAIIFPPGADSSGGRHISVTPAVHLMAPTYAYHLQSSFCSPFHPVHSHLTAHYHS